MMQIDRNLTDPIDGFPAEKEFLILARDSKYSSVFRITGRGITNCLTHPKSRLS